MASFDYDISSIFYYPMAEKKKKFHYTLRDRPFAIGDFLHIYEVHPVSFQRTGRVSIASIDYILDDEIFPPLAGWCILSITIP